MSAKQTNAAAMQARLAVLLDDMASGRVSAVAVVAIAESKEGEGSYSEEHWVLTDPSSPSRYAEHMAQMLEHGLRRMRS